MASRRVGPDAELNNRLRQAALAGSGVVTLEELLELGFSRDMVRRRIACGLLITVVKGVYALPGSKLGPDGKRRAAVCSGGRGAALSHGSALALLGLVAPEEPIHVVSRSGAVRDRKSRVRPSREFGFSVEFHQTRHLPTAVLTERRGIRTTKAERSLRDFAALAPEADLLHALSQGERERSLDWARLGHLLAHSIGHRGTRRLRRVMARWEPEFADARSAPEEDLLMVVVRSALPMPLVNAKIGRFVADFYWPEFDLVVEMDPWGTHNSRESFHLDRRKSVELEARGIRVIRFTWDDLYGHADRTAGELLAILIRQGYKPGETPNPK